MKLDGLVLRVVWEAAIPLWPLGICYVGAWLAVLVPPSEVKQYVYTYRTEAKAKNDTAGSLGTATSGHAISHLLRRVAREVPLPIARDTDN